MTIIWQHAHAVSLAAAAAGVLYVVLACEDRKQEAPAASPAAQTVQCGKDSDCKGDRVCDHGSCVSPR